MSSRRHAIYPLGLVLVLASLVGWARAAPGRPAETFAPSLWATPLEIDFGIVAVGDTTAPIAVTLTNSGNSFVGPFDSGAVGAPFLRTHNCDAGLFPGTTCQYMFTFAPEIAGDFTATSAITTEAGPVNIVLHGQAAGPLLHISPLFIDFGSVRTNQPATPQYVVARNAGPVHLDFEGITAPAAPFKVTPNCVGGLAPNDTCLLQMDFMPTSTGDFSETVDILTTGGSATISLIGHGRTENFGTGQRVTPRVIDFGPVPMGSTTAVQKVIIYNQNESDHLVDWDLGVLEAPFAMTTNCQDDIDPGTSCEINYTFAPVEAGEVVVTHAVTNNLGTVEIELQGTGLTPELWVDKLALDFGPVQPGQTSPAQVVTVTNNGPTSVQNIFGGAPHPPGFGASTTCGDILGPDESCQFTYTFQPTQHGRYEAVSQFSTDPNNENSYTVALYGGVAVPQLNLAFQPPAVDPGQITTLRASIANPNPSIALMNVALAATLPAGLVVADPPGIFIGPGCVGGSFQPVAGGDELAFSGGMLGGQTCVIEVDVLPSAEGLYSLTTHATSDSGDSPPAVARLAVGDVDEGFELFLPFVRR